MSETGPATSAEKGQQGTATPAQRSLLRVKVPVAVTLAITRQPLFRILELAPGAIIQLDKSCEEPLLLEAGKRPIAEGDTVKVGERFGLRITAFNPTIGKQTSRPA